MLPARALAYVFAVVEVERATIDLHEDAVRGPAQVGLLARDASVQARERVAGCAQHLERADLGSAAGALNR
jgi:hypothetical protein